MGQPVEQRRRHFRVAEHAWPFAEGEVGGDDGSRTFIVSDKRSLRFSRRGG